MEKLELAKRKNAMKEKEDSKLKVYLFEATGFKKNEDGTYSSERETLGKTYCAVGDLMPTVDYGDYWSHGGDGYLSLTTEDGWTVDTDINTAYDYMVGYGISGTRIAEMANSLDEPGKWAEACLGDAAKTTFRVTLLDKLPKISAEKTHANSDLSIAQEHCIKIDGVPIFPEGETVHASVSTMPTLVLRPKLRHELAGLWEEHILRLKDVRVKVTVDLSYERFRAQKMTLEAETREDLDKALSAVGILKPSEVEPDVVNGINDTPFKFVATVVLCEEID